MSKYTTEVRYICESLSGLRESKGFNDIETVLNSAYSRIFDFSYPIFDNQYKPDLEKKILRHYYTREICEETVGLWKLRLCNRMNDIMPYYNQLYESVLLNYNPLTDIDLSTTHQRVNNGTMSNSGTTGNTEIRNLADGDTHSDTTTTQNWDRYSDTPQGALTNVENDTYLTNARKINQTEGNSGSYTRTHNGTIGNSGTSSLSGTSRDVEDYLERITGKTASHSYAKLIKEFRENFLNVDLQVINELKDLFFGLW